MQREDGDYVRGHVKPTSKEKDRFASLGLIGAVITTILASVCCGGPIVLVLLGVSGAWIGNLMVFEPYRLLFIFFTLSFLGAGFYRVYRGPSGDCEPGRQHLKGYLLLASAAITCPCHPLIIIALLSGTTLGIYLSANLIWLILPLTIYFIWAMLKAFKMIQHS